MTSRIYPARPSTICLQLTTQQIEFRVPWYKLSLLCHRTTVHITFLCYESKYEEARSICFSRSAVIVVVFVAFVACLNRSIINMKKSSFLICYG
mmetsp:Transcript_28011/g.43553  ORF Transcript_28011/g.43553 Transcript_28011/m.43553 type:complete len:94 (-) Transcript_28011:1439-1720(-)